MGVKLVQPSLTAGEMSPALYARVDLARYQSGLRACRNFIVRAYGGVENRAGLQFLHDCAGDESRRVRVIPFVVSNVAAYAIELGHLYMRFSSADGTRIEASPGVPYQIAAPWTEDQIFDVRFTQSADVMTLVHNDVPPRDLVRTSATSFSLTAMKAVEGPFRDINANEAIQVVASATKGTVTITSNVDIFTANAVGALFYMEVKNLGQALPWVVGERGVSLGAIRRSDGKHYRASSVPSPPAGGWTETGNRQPVHDIGRVWDGPGDQRNNGSNDYKVGIEWEYMDSGYGIVEITSVTNAKVAVGTVRKTLPMQVVGTPAAASATWTRSGDGTTRTFALNTPDPGYGTFSVTIDSVAVQSDPNYQPPRPVGDGGNVSGEGGRDEPNPNYTNQLP